ncbi:MAG: hypothetical protein A2Z39_00470 [Deltaproteobacteria bacterium RBG_19FT_COMBO_46_9]|nr:MAG: hypothetical protein A2Z39_00470 [Deltaproteobacteria bacterium RBG_19FT_COMBO_46_9]
MKQQGNPNSPADVLLKKIKGRSELDYTIFSSNQSSPLHNLASEYRKRYPKRPVHSEILISEITDPTSRNSISSPKLWIETRVIIKLMPGPVLQRLVRDRIHITYNDGTGSYYDPLNATVSMKGAQDFIHEIGHHIWNSWLIRDDEAEKQTAIHASLSIGARSRKHLPDDLIPYAHKEYATLVGAYSGQFIRPCGLGKISNRKNDLEEHFARNFDYLLRGRVLDVTHHSEAGLENLLDFFIRHGLSYAQHASLYRYLLKEIYGEKGLNYIDPKDAKDGVVMTRDELFTYHQGRIMFETGKPLSKHGKISLALDLEEDFIDFCFNRNGLAEIREALKQKGITYLDV